MILRNFLPLLDRLNYHKIGDERGDTYRSSCEVPVLFVGIQQEFK